MASARAILKETFGFDDFRPGQEEIVSAIEAGRDVLAVMPTGGGKSLCYQLPALTRKGMTVVVSPLIALMRDQVAALRASGVSAGALTSANAPDENEAILSAIASGEMKLLYMAPERLSGSIGLLRRAGVSLLAVDEAHCVSQWGHDFRPDYLTVGTLRGELGGVQTAAFTATADGETRADIVAKLFDGPPAEFLRGFDRPNLFLAFEPKANARRQVCDYVTRRKGQAGIVYCSSRRKCEDFAEHLRGEGVNALAYHAGLEAETRKLAEARFGREDDLVMVATVAFGMGVDKPDVRFVVHADLPKTVENYYQEIGRAGRDGLQAETLTLFGVDDIKLRRAQIDDSDAPDERKRTDHARLSALLALAEAPRCRRQTLLAYFEEEAAACGHCDLCLSPPARYDATVDAQKALSAIVRTGERFGIGHLIAVLRGEDGDRIRELGHDQLPTFGVGADIERGAWQDLFRQIYALGLAAVDMQHGSWRVTPEGWAVLKGKQTVELKVPVKRARGEKASRRERPPMPDDLDQDLLALLKKRRRTLADEQGVPAYVVFPDRTLIEMAAAKPSTLDEMAGLNGIGAKKLERYGTTFLEILRAG
ncbi:DNA helicase RecQ [Pararhizobium mangrovi]|uniref:DNA helicase RecQ n=1 Tax=Pararhizobium mangrovi TaxID=2590452 RepID=A0A506TXY2_9HYPH|nr:DNA helicase RecQ [Pararhizobium mangrovi]TPW26922.1 DNA helicase RecQ [Pararhizobium mangrovi]